MISPSNPSPIVVHLSGTSIEPAIPNGIGAEQKKEVLTGWENLLTQASNKESGKPRQYIVLEGQDLKLTESPREGQKKLPINQIIKISAECIRKERDMFFSREVDVDKCIEYTDKITGLTEKLISDHKEKYAHNRFRNVMRTVAGATSFLLIGLPFYLIIRNEDKKFESEIQEMKRTLNSGDGTPGISGDYYPVHSR